MTGPATAAATGFDPVVLLKGMTSKPGVYHMLDGAGKLLYVGKARSLKKRLASYFRDASQLVGKTRAMVAQVRAVQVTVTHTEAEALLLEANLIKAHQPRYNILLKDDKSYPYIYLSLEQDFPRLAFHRGARKGKGRYFGPYPSAGAVRESLNLIQKLFRVRQCEDSFYRNRTRPCLQYQIQRCTAPCVGYVREQDYAEEVRHAIMFLEGKSNQMVEELGEQMQRASVQLKFEQAARFRDQIAALQRVQERQYISMGSGDIDVVAAQVGAGLACITVFFIRGGRNLGSKVFFPGHVSGIEEAEILGAFLKQYYLAGGRERPLPMEILCSHTVDEQELLETVLGERAGRRVRIGVRLRGERARWLKMARENAAVSLAQRRNDRDSVAQRLDQLRDVLALDETPNRMECFDISHTQGEATVASCVVFGSDGPLKSDYRRYNINDIQPGDDYAAMRQALERRYTRLKKEDARLPDVLLIDGGKGQLRQAVEVLEDLQVDGVTLVGVAKGEGRKPGLESLFLPGSGRPLILPPDSIALHLIQHIRDEAHRFAITGHRQRREKRRHTSLLEEIPGIGAKRRQYLLTHFGGLKGLHRAGVEDLTRVPGISKTLAQQIYDTFHADP